MRSALISIGLVHAAMITLLVVAVRLEPRRHRRTPDGTRRPPAPDERSVP